jgi:predicted dehydrogenase
MRKITMLGSGLIGTFYTMTLQGYRAKDKVSVIYSRTEENARHFASKYEVPRWTTDLGGAIRDPETDVVVVGLPNHQHLEAVHCWLRRPARQSFARNPLDAMPPRPARCWKPSSEPGYSTGI